MSGDQGSIDNPLARELIKGVLKQGIARVTSELEQIAFSYADKPEVRQLESELVFELLDEQLSELTCIEEPDSSQMLELAAVAFLMALSTGDFASDAESGEEGEEGENIHV